MSLSKDTVLAILAARKSLREATQQSKGITMSEPMSQERFMEIADDVREKAQSRNPRCDGFRVEPHYPSFVYVVNSFHFCPTCLIRYEHVHPRRASKS